MSDYMAQLLQNPPTTRAPVKRYYANWLHDTEAMARLCAEPERVVPVPVVLASALDRLEREVGERDKRIEALEAGLRKIVARWPSTTNPNCDDYERGYGQATSDIAQIARALLATTHNQEFVT